MNNYPANDWIQVHDPVTFRGKVLHPLAPEPDEIMILTAARALSYMCRYSGNLLTGTRSILHKRRPGVHTENCPGKNIYSVAQHSVILSYCVPPFFALEGLVHDITEGCGLPDMPGPVKRSLPDYINAENVIYDALIRDYGFPLELPPAVQYWDRRIVATERRDLLGPCKMPWPADIYTPLPLRILPMNPLQAYKAWYDRWQELTWGRRENLAIHKVSPEPTDARMRYNRMRFRCGLKYMRTGVELAGLSDFEAQQREWVEVCKQSG